MNNLAGGKLQVLSWGQGTTGYVDIDTDLPNHTTIFHGFRNASGSALYNVSTISVDSLRLISQSYGPIINHMAWLDSGNVWWDVAVYINYKDDSTLQVGASIDSGLTTRYIVGYVL